MLKLKNIVLFFLLSAILYLNLSLTIDRFGMIEKFQSIKEFSSIINIDSLFIIFYAIQLFLAYVTSLMETIILSLVSGYIVRIKLRFKESFTISVIANIFSALINLFLLLVIQLESMNDFIKLSFFPSAWIVLSFIYLVYLKIIKKYRVSNGRLAMGEVCIILVGSVLTISNILTIGRF